MVDSRRDEWRKCVEDHANEDWGSTCDACLFLPEVYARLESLEARLPDYLAAVEALERIARPVASGYKGDVLNRHELTRWMVAEARTALARLRDEVPA